MDKERGPSIGRLTPLFKLALVSGVDSAISMHIRLGADVNGSDEHGQFPLLLAAKSGNADVCAMLLKAGADPSKTDALGQTAFDVAQSRGMQNVASLLSSHTDSESPIALIPERVVAQIFDQEQKVGSPAFDPSDVDLWLPLNEQPLPQPDSTFANEAGTIQFQISSHTPIDTYEDWSATEIDFPNVLTATRARYSDGDRKQIIHRILSDGLSDGFVTSNRVLNDLYKEHDEPDETEYSNLLVTLEELQIYLDDETNEYLPAHNEIALSDSLSRSVEEGILFFEDLIHGGDNITRLYARNFSSSRRLSREDEVSLAKSIEHSLYQIMAAAFSWPGTWQIFAGEIAKIDSGDIDLEDVVELISVDTSIASAKHSALGGLAAEMDDDFGAGHDVDGGIHDSPAIEKHSILDELNKLRFSIEASFEASNWPTNEWIEFEIFRREWTGIIASFRFTSSFVTKISDGPKRLLHELDRIKALIAIFELKNESFEDKHVQQVLIGDYGNIIEVKNIVSKLPYLIAGDSRLIEFKRLVEELFAAQSQSGCSLSNLKLIAEEIATHEHAMESAKRTFVESNLRLVYSIARKYLGTGMDLSDLVQEGNLGLLKAVDKFDYRRGFKFSTYSVNWIRQKILRYISDFGRTIRLPVHIWDTVRVMERTERDIERRTNYYPTAAEVAVELGLDEHKIRTYRRISQEIISLTKTEDDSEETEEHLYSKLAAPDELTEDASMRSAVASVLETLTRREAKVIQLRFGIGCNEHTLEEAGRMFDVTRERIRQIESKALRKLRHPSRADSLSGFIALSSKPNKRLELTREKKADGEDGDEGDVENAA